MKQKHRRITRAHNRGNPDRDFARLQKIFSAAFRHHQEGRLGEAEGVYRSVLAWQPAHADALHLMGVGMHQTGRGQGALAAITRAIRITPGACADYHANLATLHRSVGSPDGSLKAGKAALCIDPASATALQSLGFSLKEDGSPRAALAAFERLMLLDPTRAETAFHRADILAGRGHLAEAVQGYKAALCLRPTYQEPYINGGNAFRGLGRTDAAAAWYEIARLLDPHRPEAQYNHGNAHYDRGDIERAMLYYRVAISLKPGYVQAYHGLGNVLHKLRRNEQAMASYVIAAKLKPDYAKAITGRGDVLKALGRRSEAIACYDAALRFSPDSAVTHLNRGVALYDLGRPDEALAAYRAALCLAPDHAPGHNNCGNVLRDFRRNTEALAAYEAAIRIQPGLTEAVYNRANVLYDLGRIEEARASYETALRQRPDLPEARSQLFHCRRQVCDWQGIADIEADLVRPISHLDGAISPFVLLATNVPIDQQTRIARDYGIKQTGMIPRYTAWSRRAGGRLRIGYLSYDFRNHPVAQLCVEMIERHDRERFEVIGYSYGPDDGSDMRARLEKGFDRFVDIQALSHADAARRIHEDEIDILVDLTGHTRGARPQIAAHRPAPVQVNFLGYPGTMAIDCIDYIIADSQCIPPGQEADYTEKVVRLPDCYQPNDRHKPIASAPQSRSVYGLPETGVVFCCFNNSFKITPEIFAVWMRLLAAVPGSVLWLLEANRQVKENLLREAANAGLAPDRLVFAPRRPLAEHLARHRLADLFLDTLPYNAHTTASDALWAGLPVLTCRGLTFPSRVAASLLTAIGLPELITDSVQEYEALALALVRNPDRLREIRDRLAANRDKAPLFDTALFTRNIEAAYDQMAAFYRAGQPPRSFDVRSPQAPASAVPNERGRTDDDAPARFDAAIRAHQAGRLAEAERGYRVVLAIEPLHPGALHLLGVVFYQSGRTRSAYSLIRRALWIRHADPAAHSNLGLVMRDLGRLDEAVLCFDEAIRQKPDYVEAHNNRGLASQDLGRFGEALVDFTRAVCLRPDYCDALSSRSAALRKLKRLGESGACCDQALRLQPDSAEAHSHRAAALRESRHFKAALAAAAVAICLKPDHPQGYYNRSLASAEGGDHTGALASGETILRLSPHVAQAHDNRGTALLSLGRTAEALEAFESALGLKSDYVEAHANRGAALKGLNRPRDSLLSGHIALCLDPGFAVAYYNCGLVLHEDGLMTEAATAYRRAIALDPDRAAAHNNLGLVLGRLGELEPALAALDRAVRLKPDYAEAQSNRGVALIDLARYSDSVEAFQRATALAPDYGEAYVNRAVAFKELGRFDEAVSSAERALQISPDLIGTLSLLVTCLQEICAWSNLADRQKDMMRLSLTQPDEFPPFMLLAMESSLAQQREAAERHSLHKSDRIDPLPARGTSGHGKIRLGYLSYDFRTHAVAQLCVDLIERHDRTQVEVIGYSYGPDDGSALRERLKKGFDRFIDLRALNHEEAARRIYQDEIDILIDLTGFTRGARPQIAAYRPAPVQVNFLGYPGTMGADFIDYIIADPICIPPKDQIHYREKVVRLPDCYQPNDRQRPIAAETPTRAACGLPEAGVVFCCFNNSFKITPEIFAIWMRLLAQVPDSVLWLLDANALVCGNLRREADAAGIAPERLVLAPRIPLPEHLARHRLADLFLDTLPYNAHTTGSDALWAGLPMITCRGRTFPGRVAASLLNAVGLPDLVTESLAEYEALALELAHNPAKLAGIKARLAANRDTAPLFDSERFARTIEAAYRRMWEVHQAGEPPQSFDVEG